MSIGQLLEKGYSMTMEDNLLMLYDYDKRLIMQSALEKIRIFKVNIEVSKSQCLSATDIEKEIALWHKRLWHQNIRSLGQLNSKNLMQNF